MPANFPPIQALASVAHKWVNAISGAGVATATQPAASDISGLAASATTDTTNASNITTGTLAAARGGAGTVSGALKANGSGAVSQAAAADLSNGTTGSGSVVLATSPTISGNLAINDTSVSSAAAIDTSGSTATNSVSNGSNAAIGPSVTVGLIVIHGSDGQMAFCMAGGGGIAIIAQSNSGEYVASSSPSSGHIGVQLNSSVPTVYNNFGSALTFNVSIWKTV